MTDKTIQFSIKEDSDAEMRKILGEVYTALVEKGYNPISQLVGYLLSEDPTYITTHNNARSLIRKVDRDELMQALVKNFLDK
ncbi:MAG: IreB family regulatory phosphoprotein [Clostridia bacterium]|nr:IreB family regulatory phosphoprotein [Clostridia bacterium]MBO7690798.1 IreB family regulatory phosphoprotein [Clostridia bacterium]MBP5272327.1 IreB family regulatory phosphoprotein [Clostridia bacterium]MBP5459630.1 IreB family regulatory phosphoprotein [Clostridia bacterium]